MIKRRFRFVVIIQKAQICCFSSPSFMENKNGEFDSLLSLCFCFEFQIFLRLDRGFMHSFDGLLVVRNFF